MVPNNWVDLLLINSGSRIVNGTSKGTVAVGFFLPCELLNIYKSNGPNWLKLLKIKALSITNLFEFDTIFEGKRILNNLN